MLDQDGLMDALKTGQGAANCCNGHFCRAGATVDDGRYLIWHNGTGSRDTASEVIHSSEVLGWSGTKLGERITVWIAKIHRGEHIDLNIAG